MAYTLDDIKRIKQGGNGASRSSSSSSTSSSEKQYTIDDIKRINGKDKTGAKVPEPTDPSKIKKVYSYWSDPANKTTYDTVEEYDKAIEEAKPSNSLAYEGKKFSYGVSNAVNGFMNSIGDKWFDLRSLMPDSWDYTNDDYKYEALKSNRELLSRQNQYDEYANYANNDDFDKYSNTSVTNNSLGFTREEYESKLGHAVTDDEWKKVEGTSNYLGVGFDEDNGDLIQLAEDATMGWARSKTYNALTDDEKKVGSYIYGKYGSTAFAKYLDDLELYIGNREYNNALNEKKEDLETGTTAQQMQKRDLNTIGTIVSNVPEQMVTAVDYAARSMFNKDYNPYNQANMNQDIRQAISEDIANDTPNAPKVAGENLYSFLYNTNNSAIDSAVGAALGGTYYTSLMGTGALNNAYKEAYESGLPADQAMSSALAQGTAEAMFEYVSLDRLLKPKSVSSWKALLKETAAQAGVEGSEEVFTEMANIFTDSAINGTGSDIQSRILELRKQGYSDDKIKSIVAQETANQIKGAFYGGAISGGLMSGVFNGANYHNLSNVGNSVDRTALSDYAKNNRNSSTYSEYAKLASQYGENLENAPSAKVGELYTNAVDRNTAAARNPYRTQTSTVQETTTTTEHKEASNLNGHVGEIRDALKANNVENINRVISALTTTKKASKSQIELRNSEEIVNIVSSVLGEDYITPEMSKNGIETTTTQEVEKEEKVLSKAFYDSMLLNSAYVGKDAVSAEKNVADAKESLNIQEDTTDSDVVSDTTTDDSKVQYMFKKYGTYYVQTTDGTKKASNVTVSPNVAEVLSTSATIKDKNLATAYVQGYGGQDLTAYSDYVASTYQAGQNFDTSFGDENKAKEFLGAETFKNVWNAGAENTSTTRTENTEKTDKVIEKYSSKNAGKFDDGAINVKELNSEKLSLYNFFRGLSKVGGLNIRLINDMSSKSENGEYSTDFIAIDEGGLITVNLSARVRANDMTSSRYSAKYVLPVMAHEITHAMEVQTPKIWETLKSAVLQNLENEGMNISDEINQKIKDYEDAGQELNEDDAIREIVAQACEGMMSNTTTMDKVLSNMTVEEAKGLRKALDRVFKSIRRLIQSLMGTSSAPNRYAEAMLNNYDQIQNIWAQGLSAYIAKMNNIRINLEIDEDMTAEDGTTVVGHNNLQYNQKTYEKEAEGNFKLLRSYLTRNGITGEEQEAFLKQLDEQAKILKKIRNEVYKDGEKKGEKMFPHFDAWGDVDSLEEAVDNLGIDDEKERDAARTTLERYVSAIVNNSDYPFNFDLSTVCKKRRALNTVLNALVRSGELDNIVPDETCVTDLVELIKKNGFEVACALCFVDSKRYRVGTWAKSITDGFDVKGEIAGVKQTLHSYGWNELVDLVLSSGKVSVNEFNLLNRDIPDNGKKGNGTLASSMSVEELEKSGSLKKLHDIIDKEVANNIANSEYKFKHKKGNENKEFDKNSAGTPSTRNYKFVTFMLEHPDSIRYINPAELIASDGIDMLRIKAPELHNLINGASGMATPKLSHDMITYDNDVLKKDETLGSHLDPDDLYKIAGYRIQSFSDYMANAVFDYVQLVADLAANKYPAHAYTKEYFFVKIFGMCGIKINMSIVPKAIDVDPELKKNLMKLEEKIQGKKKITDDLKQYQGLYDYYKEHAGLAEGTNEDGSADFIDPKDGSKWHYIIEDESFGSVYNKDTKLYDSSEGFSRAMEIQKDARYNKNCGIIWVGVSDNHIRAMMRDGRIPMIIPYHKSNINPNVAHLRNIGMYNEYTIWQEEKELDGSSLSDAHKAVKKQWNFYDDLKITQDPVQTSKNYVKFCLDNGIRPKFAKFAFEPGYISEKNCDLKPDAWDHFESGYYKTLTDFRLYAGDSNGMLTSEYAGQGAVTMTYPEEFSTLVGDSLKEYEENEDRMDEKQKELFEGAKKALEDQRTRMSDSKKKSRKNLKLTQDDEDYMVAIGNADIKKANEIIKKVAAQNGYTEKVYHGTDYFGFTIIDPRESDDGISFFATETKETASTYTYWGDSRAINQAKREEEEYQERISKLYEHFKDNVDKLEMYVRKKLGFEYYVKVDNYLSDLDLMYDNAMAELSESDEVDFEDPDPFKTEIKEKVLDILAEGINSKYSGNASEKVKIKKDIDEFVNDIYEKLDIYKTDEALARPAKGTTGIYSLYADTSDMLTFDADGAQWDEIPLGEYAEEYNKYFKSSDTTGSTRTIAEFANHIGSKGVRVLNVIDHGGKKGYTIDPTTVYIFFDPQRQLKSADTITEDDDGRPIIPSERFDRNNPDIRFNLKDLGYHHGDLGKSEGRANFPHTTGHFGTGTYFFGSEDIEPEYNSRNGVVPVETIHKYLYNLYRPESYRDGVDLHDALAEVDNSIDAFKLLDMEVTESSIDDAEYNIDNGSEEEKASARKYIQELYDILGRSRYLQSKWSGFNLEEGADPDSKYDESYVDFADILNSNLDTVEDVIERASESLRILQKVSGNVSAKSVINDLIKFNDENPVTMKDYHEDSLATMFMKRAGYEGVDVTGIDGLDNSYYGSVVYDLKMEDLDRKKAIGTARFSLKAKDTADIAHTEEQYQEMMKKLKTDIKVLKDYIKQDKKLTHGKVWNNIEIDNVAKSLISSTGSSISREELSKDLGIAYDRILRVMSEATVEGADETDYVMDICSDVAAEIYDQVSNKKNLTSKDISDAIEKAGIKEDIDKELLSTIKQAVATAVEEQEVQRIAVSVYSNFWTVSKVKTSADKMAEHDKVTKELIEKQKLADRIHYGQMLHEARVDRDQRMQDYKDYIHRKEALKRLDKEKRELISKIMKKAKDFGERIYKNDPKKPIPQAFKPALSGLISSIDYSSKTLLGLNGEQRETNADKSMGLMLQRLGNTMNELAIDQAMDTSSAYDSFQVMLPEELKIDIATLSEKINKIEKVYHDDGLTLQYMSNEDLAMLNDILNRFTTIINSINQTLSAKNARELNVVGRHLIDTSDEFKKTRKENAASEFLTIANKTPYYFFKHLGAEGEYMFSLLADGQDKYTFNEDQIEKYTEKLFEGLNDKINEWKNTTKDFDILEPLTESERAKGKTAKTRKVTMTYAQIMELYCLSKRDQGMSHITQGGITIEAINTKDKLGKTKQKIDQQKTLLLTTKELEKITSVVENNAQMKKVADGLQKFMNTVCQEWGNEITMKRFGIKSFLEQNYYPVRVDTDKLYGDISKNVKQQSIFYLLNMSFTKTLKTDASTAVFIGSIFDTFASHSCDMALYNSMALPVLDVIRIWNYSESEKAENGRSISKKTVKEAVRTIEGEKANDYISTLLKNMNNDSPKGKYDNLTAPITRAYKTAAVGFNIQTVMLQPLSIIRASYVMNPKYITAAMVDVPSIKKNSAEMKKYVGVALWKSKGFFGLDLGRTVQARISGDESIIDKAVEASLKGCEAADEMTWAVIWQAVKMETKKTTSLKPGTEEFYEACAKRAREVMYSTQVFDSPLTKSDFMRDPGFFAKQTTAFMAEPTVTMNMLMDCVEQFNQAVRKGSTVKNAVSKHGANICRALGVYTVSAIAESALRSIIGKIRDFDGDDDEFDGILKDFRDRLIQELLFLNKIPYIKDLIEILNGYQSTRLDTAYFSNLYSAGKAIWKVINGSADWSYSTTYKLGTVLGQLTGVPFANVARTFKEIWNNTIARANDHYIK